MTDCPHAGPLARSLAGMAATCATGAMLSLPHESSGYLAPPIVAGLLIDLAVLCFYAGRVRRLCGLAALFSTATLAFVLFSPGRPFAHAHVTPLWGGVPLVLAVLVAEACLIQDVAHRGLCAGSGVPSMYLLAPSGLLVVYTMAAIRAWVPIAEALPSLQTVQDALRMFSFGTLGALGLLVALERGPRHRERLCLVWAVLWIFHAALDCARPIRAPRSSPEASLLPNTWAIGTVLFGLSLSWNLILPAWSAPRGSRRPLE